jgi:hypothetical protein
MFHFELVEFSGITVSHQVFVKPKIEGYELPAISKWHNVICHFVKKSENSKNINNK